MITRITHGPWLSSPDIGQVTVAFTTEGPCAACIEIRSENGATRTQFQTVGGQIMPAETLHVFYLKDLNPGETYSYAVTAFLPDSGECSQAGNSFTVFSRERTGYSFLVLADLQFPPEKKKLLVNRYYELAQASRCDFIVGLGDLVNYIENFEQDALTDMIDFFCELGAGSKPVVFLRGNHELRGKEAWKWNEYFALDQNSSYSLFRQGNAAFLALDSWADEPGGLDSRPAFRMNRDREFLEDEKKFIDYAVRQESFQSAKFRILLSHGTSHSHIDQFLFLNPNMHELTDEFFAGKQPRFQLHAWLCGHIHHYIRTVPLTRSCASISRPPQPVTTAENYSFPVLTTDGPDVMAEVVPPSGIQTSVFLVTVNEDDLDIQAISEERGVIDHILISAENAIQELTPIEHYLWQ